MEKTTSETSKNKIKKNVSSERWVTAQDSEKEYWEEFNTESLLREEGYRHEKKAEILLKEWSKFIKVNKNIKILQIGCGPEDVINYFSIGKRYAIDPLADFYTDKFNLSYNSMNFLKARGEEIPFRDKYFDIVILANVLDHVELPEKVLLEIRRVLKDDGIFHFENLFYQKEFIKIAKIWGKFKEIFTQTIFNIHHPYMFTFQDLKNLVLGKFSILSEEIGKDIPICNDFEDMKKKKKTDKNIKVRILAYFGLYGTINYTAICKKR